METKDVIWYIDIECGYNVVMSCAMGEADLAAEERGAAKPRGRGRGRRNTIKFKFVTYG